MWKAKHEVVDSEFFKRFGAGGLYATVLCSICGEKIEAGKGVAFVDHGLFLCSKCLEELLYEMKEKP